MTTSAGAILEGLNGLAAEINTPEVPAVIVGAVYEFQVFYTRAGIEGRADLGSILVRAETQEQARALIESHGSVVTVGPGIPVIDWSRPYFTRDELEGLIRCSPATISKALERGLLKYTPNRKLFSRKQVDAFLERTK